MKIELPLETWTELFGFVPRFQLVQLVPHIGKKLKNRGRKRKRQHQQFIGDRQFVSFVQFFLHICGQITLGQLHIYDNEPIVSATGKYRNPLPLAVVPIPENVKNFESIYICNYEESVIDFLQEFQRNSLLTNVNLCFWDCLDSLLEIMTNFVPLVISVNSITVSSYNSYLLDQLQCEYSELAIPMLTSALVLIAECYNCRDVWFCDWLHIPREDGKPRILYIGGCQRHPSYRHSYFHFIKYIKKDFLEANQQQAVSFFIQLGNFRDDSSVQSLTLENGQTLEKLVIKRGLYVTISRYPVGINEAEWMEEMSQDPDIYNRKIEFGQY